MTMRSDLGASDPIDYQTRDPLGGWPAYDAVLDPMSYEFERSELHAVDGGGSEVGNEGGTERRERGGRQGWRVSLYERFRGEATTLHPD